MKKGTYSAFFHLHRLLVESDALEASLSGSQIGSSMTVKWLRWIVLIAAVAAVYVPGLSGGFVFDDDVNILQNDSLRITSLQWEGLWSAAMSGHAGPLGRPVALLSFALNLLWLGPNPFYFKLVNLSIHLVNVLLVGALARSLCIALETRGAARKEADALLDWSGWIVAALWALHPINLTGVLYVVQRMTSLSTLFGLAALLVFVRYRESTYQSAVETRRASSAVLTAVAILLLIALSAFSKESGLLFGPLLIWIEYFAFGFRFNGERVHIFGVPLKSLATALLGAACLYIAAFKIPPMVSSAAFANRDFGLRERVLTEMRVVFYYLRLILLPRNSELSLYHDDFVISKSLWDPITTVLSLGGLLGITGIAVALRKIFPPLLFGWGWFLIAHALESTVFPLELVHEHRNYFATVGLFMLLPLGLLRVRKPELTRLFSIMLCSYVAVLGFITHVRALQWSNLVDWAALEASNHPGSARANYELARDYAILRSNTGDDRFGQLADEALTQAQNAYLPGVLPYMARIQLSYFRSLQPDPTIVENLKAGLRNGPFYNVNTSVLTSFVTCQIERKCSMPDEQALEILSEALANPRISKNDAAEITKLEAQYRINRLGDLKGGASLIEQASQMNDIPPTRVMYAQALAFQGKFKDALVQLDIADSLDTNRSYRPKIERERSDISAAAQAHQ